jgi:hypothetical protein
VATALRAPGAVATTDFAVRVPLLSRVAMVSRAAPAAAAKSWWRASTESFAAMP